MKLSKVLFILLLLLINSSVFSQVKISIAVLEPIGTGDKELSQLLINEFQKSDSIYVYSKSFIDSLLISYKIDSIHHDILFSDAIGKITKSDYIVQTKVLTQNNSSQAQYCFFDVLLGKYIRQYNIEIEKEYSKSLPNNVRNVVVDFTNYYFNDRFNFESKKRNDRIDSYYIDSLNQNLSEKGMLIAESDNPNANFYIEGDSIGIVPILVKDLELGRHSFSVKNKEFNISYKSSIYFDRAQVYKIDANLTPLLLSVKGEPHDAVIKINSIETESSPVDKYVVKNYENILNITKDGYFDFNTTVFPSQLDKQSIEFNLEPKSKMNALLYSTLFPGAGQLFRDDDYRGYFFMGAEIFSLISVISSENEMKNKKEEYINLQDKYFQLTLIPEIEKIGNQLTTKFNELKEVKERRNIFLGIAAGIWVANIVEAFLWSEKPSFNKKINVSVNTNNLIPQIGINYSF